MDVLNLELILKMCVALGVVLLAFGASVYLFRKFGSRFGLGIQSRRAKTPPSEISVETFYNLGPGRSVYVLKVDSRRVLIGATQTHMNLLVDLGEDLSGADSEDFSRSLVETSTEEKKSRFSKSFLGLPRV